MNENNYQESKILPMLALRGLVLFPGMLLHFDVGRKKSVIALNEAMTRDQLIFLTSQKNLDDEDPTAEGLYPIGCIAVIKQVVRMNDDNVRVVVEGLRRARSVDVFRTEPSFVAEVVPVYERQTHVQEDYRQAIVRYTRTLFERYASVNGKLPPDVIVGVLKKDDCGQLADFIAANINLELEDKQKILNECQPVRRLETLCSLLETETDLLSLEQKINEKVHQQMDDNQKEYYLREQMKAISEELGDFDSPQDEADEYREQIEKTALPEEIREKLLKETDKLFKMPVGSHEATVVRNYLDTALELPWGKVTKESTDLKKATRLLEREHYSMKKVKERILEVMAVRSLNPDLHGQIICLVGPPGVGKTSIAKSLAKCMNRNYVRISLGGVRDESDIRGHRRTYIGAMPGRLMSAVAKAKSCNPLILLDEVDKLGSDYRGDPSAALLEALDSEQNKGFVDHYLDFPFDLSQVLFVTTANDASAIPEPLFDRMDVIELSSYTREEKFQIAKRHLLPKQLKANGLTAAQCRVRDGALYEIIDHYTKEAGVRGLEKRIAELLRRIAKRIVEAPEQTASVTVKPENLREFLGEYRYKINETDKADEIGVTNGLAWTSVGGELLPIEVLAVPGSGKLQLTGSLGDVMKESANAAVSYVRFISPKLRITDPEFYKNADLHIHAPEGAVPKDGPSAGVTMTTSLVSALTGIPVRGDIAMTGEISLHGKVMPIGGLKEKSMAAYRAGLKRVLIPSENLPDLQEIDPVVKESLEFIPVKTLREVLELALTQSPFCAPDALACEVRLPGVRKPSGSSAVSRS